MASGEDTMFTVAESAAYMRVSENTVYNWLNDGDVPHEIRNGTKMIPLPGLRLAKVLRLVDVLNRPELKELRIGEEEVVRAAAAGAANPSAAPDKRYSMIDIEAIVAFKRGEWKPPEVPHPATEPAAASDERARASKHAVPIEPDEFLVRAGRWHSLVEYITKHGDPMRLPPWFWDTRDCPEFVPPAGVFRFTYWLRGVLEEAGESVMCVRRSAGWLLDRAGHLVEQPEDEQFDYAEDFSFPPGGEVPEYAVQNLKWRTLETAWDEAWYLRRRQLRPNGINPLELPNSWARRDRRAVIALYHRDGWGPSDLPDWFWDTEECPPFEPPNDVALFVYGQQGNDPATGEVVTFINRSASRQWLVGEERIYHQEPEDGQTYNSWDRGSYPAGSRPARFETPNREWDAAEHAWREEWLARGRRRRGEG